MNKTMQKDMRTFRQTAIDIFSERPEFPWLNLIGIDGDREFTLKELAARVYDYCNFYESKGVRSEDIVLVILKESLDLFASFFAGILYGALPAYFAYPSPKQSREAFLASVENLIAYNHVRIVVSFDEVHRVLGSSSISNQPDFLGCFNMNDVKPCNSIALADVPVTRSEAFLQFSSGTTGAKKGVKISGHALFNQIEAYSNFVQFNDKSRIVSWLPHYHDMGLVACMLMPFVRNIPLYMMSPFEWVKNPRMLLEAVSRHTATHMWQPNFALGHMSKSIPDNDLEGLDLSSLIQLTCCSEPVLYKTVEEFVKKFSRVGLNKNSVVNCYAMAENTFAITAAKRGPINFLHVKKQSFVRESVVIEDPEGEPVASAGEPLSNVQIRICDESGNELGADKVGEVTIKSDCMLSGYHNNPTATANAFIADWFKTGDMGFMHKGELYITGRKKDIIIVGGENIYPQDIELLLNEEPYLIPGRNVVFGVEDNRVGTERVVILAEACRGSENTDTTPLKTKIFNALNISISEIILLPHMTLKKGTAGKVSRHLNKQEYLSGAFAATDRGEGTDILRKMVLNVIPGTVKPHIEPETPLLSSGIIDSFGFIDLILGLEEIYDIRIPKNFWQQKYFQTIRDIEKTIAMIKDGTMPSCERYTPDTYEQRAESLNRLRGGNMSIAGKPPLIEKIINAPFLKGSWLYRFLFKIAGIRIGRNVIFLGRAKVKLRGNPENIMIGDNVVLGDNVDLRIRENGRIILHNRVYLDSNVRIVAARDGIVDIGLGSEIGGGSIINSGGITKIGEFSLIAGNVNINSSRHGTLPEMFIKEQPHSHGEIEIGNDVWIGSGASILINTKIHEGAIIASNSLVSGDIPAFSICAGVPAKIISYR